MNATLTVNQLLNACKEHKYLLMRDCYNTNYLVGVCSAWALKKIEPSDKLTSCIGFIPCNFMEYITYKEPFIR